MNHSHLYFIVIDSDDNVFGHYHNGIIDKIVIPISDKSIFMFTLNSNGRCEIKKFENKERYVFSFIFNNYNFNIIVSIIVIFNIK